MSKGVYKRTKPPWNKGIKSWVKPWLGKHHSEETKKKISEAKRGKRCSPETEFKKGRKIQHSQETRRKLSESACRQWKEGKASVKGLFKKGHKGYKTFLGKKLAPEHRRKLSLSHIGLQAKEKHPNWIKDRSKLKKSEDRRNDTQYVYWARQVKKRDKRKCKLLGPDCYGRLEAHHIQSWKDHPLLRYDLNNGITLCLAHHPRSRSDELRLKRLFMELILT